MSGFLAPSSVSISSSISSVSKLSVFAFNLLSGRLSPRFKPAFISAAIIFPLCLERAEAECSAMG